MNILTDYTGRSFLQIIQIEHTYRLYRQNILTDYITDRTYIQFKQIEHTYRLYR